MTVADKAEVVADVELDNVVTMNGKDFTIGPPDALIMLRALRVLSGVLQRADTSAKELGIDLFKQAAETAKDGAEAEVGGDTPAVSDTDALLQKAMVLISIMRDEDLLTFASAILQYPDESAGKRWLQKYGIRLAPLMQALILNLNQMDDVLEALRVFTPALKGLKLITSLVKPRAADGTTQSGSS